MLNILFFQKCQSVVVLEIEWFCVVVAGVLVKATFSLEISSVHLTWEINFILVWHTAFRPLRHLFFQPIFIILLFFFGPGYQIHLCFLQGTGIMHVFGKFVWYFADALKIGCFGSLFYFFMQRVSNFFLKLAILLLFLIKYWVLTLNKNGTFYLNWIEVWRIDVSKPERTTFHNLSFFEDVHVSLSLACFWSLKLTIQLY